MIHVVVISGCGLDNVTQSRVIHVCTVYQGCSDVSNPVNVGCLPRESQRDRVQIRLIFTKKV